MNKKILLTTLVLVPSVAVGGMWIYQANLFEKSIAGDIGQMQESLKKEGISFTYDGLKVSKLLFKAHLINPTISISKEFPTGDKESKDKDSKDSTPTSFAGKVLINGEVSACFSPLMNTITFEVPGQAHIKVEQPFGLELTLPESSNSKIVIQRKEYDFWGKNPFLSLNNIQGFSTDSKETSALLNGQKFLESKGTYSDFSAKRSGKGMDISLSSDIKQIQLFNVEKFIITKDEALELFNTALSNEFSMQAALGPQDQKISLNFHINDWDSYFNDASSTFNDVAKNQSKTPSDNQMEKFFPKGTRLEIKDFTSNNKVYLSSMNGVVERLKDSLPIKISVNYKVTDEWENYWQQYHKKIIHDLSLMKLPDTLMSVVKDEQAFKTVMPKLQTLGQMNFTMNLDIPVPIAQASSGNLLLSFKCEPYDVGVDGKYSQSGSTVKINTRNAENLMKDLEGYVVRASEPFNTLYPSEIKSVTTYLQAFGKIVSKVLEPQGSKEQSVDIHMNEKGFKVGKYDILELAALLMGAEAGAPK